MKDHAHFFLPLVREDYLRKALSLSLLIFIMLPGFCFAQNADPEVVSTPLTSVNEGDDYSYWIGATDADGDPITITGPTIPSWLNLTEITDPVLTALAGRAFGYEDATGTDAKFARPTSTAVDAKGNVYVADRNNQVIRKITPDGVVTTLAGTEGSSGFKNGTGTEAQFNNPRELVADPEGNVYVMDDSFILRKIDVNGVVTSFTGIGYGLGDGGPDQAKFFGPQQMIMDPDRNIWLTDYNRVRKITPQGVVTTIAGTTTSGYTDATGFDAAFFSPVGIAMDSKGDLYVGDNGNLVIRKLTQTGVVTTFVGSGTSGNVDGTGAGASFTDFQSLVFDAADHLYVAQFYQHNIRRVTPDGVVTAFVGSATVGNSDGTGTEAQFVNPGGLSIDRAGNLYSAHFGAYKINKTTIPGMLLSGNSAGQAGGHPVSLNAADGNGGSSSQAFNITVVPAGQTPINLVGGSLDSDTQITVTFDAAVQTNGGNPSDFKVADSEGNSFDVISQADGTAGDMEIVLTVSDMSGAVGKVFVSYINNNSEISDAATGTVFASTNAAGIGLDRPFITTWLVDTDGGSISIPTVSGQTYDYTIDWGDGTVEMNQTGSAVHSYTTAGTKTVKITGTFAGVKFKDSGEETKIQSVEQWGSVAFTSMEDAFNGCENMAMNASDAPGLIGVTSLAHAFKNTSFNADLSKWDVGNVTDLEGMFLNNDLFNGDIESWNVGNVSNMDSLFAGNTVFNRNLNSWNIFRVASMAGMFADAVAYDQPMDGWNFFLNKNLSGMFSGAFSFNQDISSWDVSRIENMAEMFSAASSFDQDISGWKVDFVRDMSSMFADAGAFNQNLESWNIARVGDVTSMFDNSGLSITNYDNLLKKWSTLSVQSGLTLGAAGVFYCDAIAERESLINNKGWTINDGGELCNVKLIGGSRRGSMTIWARFDQNVKTNGTNPGDFFVKDASDNTYPATVQADGTAGDAFIVLTIPTLAGLTGDLRLFYTNNNDEITAIAADISTDTNDTGVDITSPFIMTWETTAANENMVLPIWGTGFDFEIDWGDGTVENITAEDATHDYATPGTYTVSITGDLKWLNFLAKPSSAVKLKTIEQWGEIEWSSFWSSFWGCTNLLVNATDAPDLSNVITMQGMFLQVNSINADIGNWDVSNVENMSQLLAGVSSFNQDISDWDVSSVTDMSSMFSGATSFNQNLNDWDVSNVTKMTSMFVEADAYNQPMDLWDVSNVTDMSFMFDRADSFNGDITTWNTTKVTGMRYMFRQAPVFNRDIGNWDVTNVESMEGMFQLANSFDQDLAAWRPGKVTDMSLMFQGNEAFNQDISDWDVSKVEDFSSMFRSAIFNNGLKNWNTGSATTMKDMFASNWVFNQDISGWNVSNVESMDNMFFSARAFDQDISSWNVSKAMKISFWGANSFNQDLSSWDVSMAELLNFNNTAINVSNYDAMIKAWSALPGIQDGTLMLVADLSYCESEAERDQLINDKSWVFNGDSKSCAPFMIGAVLESDTEVKLAFNIPVVTNETNPDDFQITDANNQTYAVSAQQDDVAGDSLLILTVADLSTATAPLRLKYTNNNDEISDLGNVEFTKTDTRGVVIEIPFVTTWTTTADGESITIPTNGTGYQYIVDWGDGTFDMDLLGDQNHTYTTAGTYTVKIVGDFPAIYLNNSANAKKLSSIERWGDNQWQSFDRAFAGAENMVLNAVDAPDLSQVTQMDRAFQNNKNLNVSLNHWNVSKIEDMQYLFFGASIFNGDISGWDTGSLTNSTGMFINTSAFNKDIGNWDMSKVTITNSMFNGATAFNQDISGWDVGNVTDMGGMFNFTEAFDQDISSWDVSKVTNMSSMFARGIFNQSINAWDVSGVEDMSYMFNFNRVFNQDLTDWNPGKVTNMSFMFNGTSAFTGDVSGWDVGEVTDMQYMFNNSTFFTSDLGNWNTSKVTNMSLMFSGATQFNADISGWDVSQVTTMKSMFSNARSFDQNLGDWDLTKITDLENMFFKTGMSINNYDLTLIGWAEATVPNGLTLGATDLEFCEGVIERQSLIDDDGWTISGDIQDCGLIAISAVKDNDSQITVTFSENVQTNGSNPSDFKFVDGLGQTFEAIAQVDGTAGDADIVLSFTDLSLAIGDFQLSYTNNHSEISDAATGTEPARTNVRPIVMDVDMQAPVLLRAFEKSTFQVDLVFDERIQPLESLAAADFKVKDANGTEVTAYSLNDLVKNDNRLRLGVNLSGLIEPVKVFYAQTTGNVGDFGANTLPDITTGVLIEEEVRMISGVKDDNMQITLTFDGVVVTNGGNPGDFEVYDVNGNQFAVTAQQDGVAGDEQIVLTVADLSTAVDTLTVTYTNNNAELTNATGSEVVTDFIGILIDILPPELISVEMWTKESIYAHFNEPVKTNAGNPGDFIVVDGNGTSFPVTAQYDANPEDSIIVLSVPGIGKAIGEVNVTYSNNNDEVTDLTGNPAGSKNTGLNIGTMPYFITQEITSVDEGTTYSYQFDYEHPLGGKIDLEGSTLPAWLTIESELYVSDYVGGTTSGFKDGKGSEATFNYPGEIVVDSLGVLYVMEPSGGRVRRISPLREASFFAGSRRANSGGFWGANELRYESEGGIFSDPRGLVTDSDGNFYTLNGGGEYITKVNPDGGIITIAGGFNSDDFVEGTGVNASLGRSAGGLSVDRQNNLYFNSGALGNLTRIAKMTPDLAITKIAGSTRGFLDGPAFSAQFGALGKMVIDSQGDLLLGDGENARFRKLSNGQVSTVSGTGIRAIADGPASVAGFTQPYALTIDGEDNIFFVDGTGTLIRKITPQGDVTTIAGTHLVQTITNGPADEATFFYPNDITVDHRGWIFISSAWDPGEFNGIRVMRPQYTLTGDAAGQAGDHEVILKIEDTDGRIVEQKFTITVRDLSDPVFTSSATASFEENGTGVAYTAVATDNATVSYALGTGNDEALFSIDGTSGKITFLAAPDFENPADANTDNSYVIEVIADDGSNQATQLVTILVTDKADETAPTVTLTAAGIAPVGGVHTITAQFSEDVTDFDVNDITISGGTISNFMVVNASTYTFEVTSNLGSADIDIAAGVAKDAADNESEAAAGLTVAFDTTPPDVTLSTTASDPNSGAFDIIATFTEDVMNITTGDFNVTNGAATAISGSGAVYTVTITPTADGTVTVNLPVSTVQDLANNDNTASNTITLENDETAPTVTIATIASDPVSGAFDITITFSEDVTGFNITDVSIGNGVASNFAGFGSVYTATITPSANGQVTVDINASAAEDVATNGNLAATQFTIENDETAPAITISTTATDPTSGAFTATFTFSEDVTGFALADITVGNGAAGSFAGSGAVYTTTITPAADGTVTVDVAGAVAQDAAGNDNTAANQFSIENDETVPTVTITSLANDPINGAFDITLTFSEDVTGLDLTDLTVINSTASNLTGSGSVYTVTITPATDGSVMVDLDAGSAQDAAGNDNTTAPQFSIQADLTVPGAPVITSMSDDTGSDPADGITNDNTLVFTGTAEANSTVEVFIDGSSIGTTTTDGSGNWTFDHSGTSLADGDYNVTATATDAATNTSSLSTTLAITVDTVAPSKAVLGSISDDTGISSTDLITNDSRLIYFGTAEPFTEIALRGGPFTLTTATVDANGDWVGDVTHRPFTSPITIFITTTDVAGNVSVNSDNYLIGFDVDAPAVQSISRADANPTTASSVDFTVSFSEEVHGLSTNSFSLAFTDTQSASIAGISASSGTSITVTVDNITGSGTFGLNLSNLTGITDVAGNGLGATFTGEVYNTNFFPTDITLSASSILENNAIGDVVATLGTTDADAGDTHTYSLVTGTGDTDNASFTILGDELKAAESFDLETKASYDIRLQTDDGRGGIFEKAVTITIDNVPEADLRITGNNDIPATPLGITTTFDITIHNDGDATLTVSSILYPTAFGGPVSGINVPANSSQVVTMDFTPTAAQLYTGDITIITNGGTGILSVSADGAIITAIDDDLLKAAAIKLYPNPATDIVTIDLSKYNSRALDIQLYDMSGIKTFGVNQYKESTLKLDVSQYHNGLYLMQFTDGKSTVQKKIMIRK